MRDHSAIDALLAVRALGALDEEDIGALERAMAAHGDCEECRRLEADHREVAGMLAHALEPRPVGDEMVEGILRQARVVPATADVDEVARRRDTRLRRWQVATGAAAAVALVLAIVLATRPGSEVVPGRRFVPFEGGQGDLALAYTPGDRGIVVWGTGLPDPGAGRVYELWLIEDGIPARGACLSPRDGALAAYLDADLGEVELLAVTIESPTCPDAPTTEPAYSAEVA